MPQNRLWFQQNQILIHQTKSHLRPNLRLRLCRPAAAPLCSVPDLPFTSAFLRASFATAVKTVQMGSMSRTVCKHVPQKVSFECWVCVLLGLKCCFENQLSVLKLGELDLFSIISFKTTSAAKTVRAASPGVWSATAAPTASMARMRSTVRV